MIQTQLHKLSLNNSLKKCETKEETRIKTRRRKIHSKGKFHVLRLRKKIKPDRPSATVQHSFKTFFFSFFLSKKD